MDLLPSAYTLHEINGPADRWLPDWLCLYELSFPAEERFLVGQLLALLRDPAALQAHHFLALTGPGPAAPAGSAEQTLVGLAAWQSLPRLSVAHLWYLAIQPGLRSRGIGGAFYRAIAHRVLAGHHLMALEVEMPALGADEAARHLRQRRIQFYHRLGARRLDGIHYLQTVGAHVAPVEMHILFHGQAALTAAEAFAAARGLFGDQVTQVGELRLV